MKIIVKVASGVIAAFGVALLLGACSPEVGSKEWCEGIKEKGVENVTAAEAADFAKHCVL